MQKRFLLRLSPDLYAQLERWAAEELRSVNGQMEFVLRQAVEARRKARSARGKPDDSRPSGPEEESETERRGKD